MASTISTQNIKEMMDQLACKIIEIEACGRRAQISYYEILSQLMSSCQHANILVTGSIIEGMPNFLCSDLDLMECRLFFPTVYWQTQEMGLLRAEYCMNDPAYLNLKVVDKHLLHKQFLDIIETDSNGYLISNIFLENAKKNLEESFSHPDPIEIHGPALTFSKNEDRVNCFQCISWPSITDGYFRRKRIWPSQQLLKKISHLQCLVVPVGRLNSLSKNIEWRLSFSLIERHLIQRMPDEFVNCMIALKGIKNKHITFSDSVKPNPFCSYFIKTACLWLCEIIPCTKSYNIIDLVKQVLSWLISCYQEGTLPHYFIPEQNLIGHLPRQLCDEVHIKLTAAQKCTWVMVMSSVCEDDLFPKNYIRDLCINLKIPDVYTSNDYQKLEFILLNHSMGTELLNSIFRTLSHPDYMVIPIVEYITKNLTNFNVSIVKWIDDGLNPQDILRSTEGHLLRVIQEIPNIVMKGYEEFFKIRFYQHLGEILSYLLVCLREKCSREDISTYQDKVIHYFTLGCEMIWPDNWRDKGMGSQFLLVKHHYLMENYEEMLLCHAKFVGQMLAFHMDQEENPRVSRIPGIVIDPSRYLDELSHRAWKVDELLYHVIKCDGRLTKFNPVEFEYYMMARLSLKVGELYGVYTSLKHIKSDILVLIIQSLIGLLLVMKMIYCKKKY